MEDSVVALTGNTFIGKESLNIRGIIVSFNEKGSEFDLQTYFMLQGLGDWWVLEPGEASNTGQLLTFLFRAPAASLASSSPCCSSSIKTWRVTLPVLCLHITLYFWKLNGETWVKSSFESLSCILFASQLHFAKAGGTLNLGTRISQMGMNWSSPWATHGSLMQWRSRSVLSRHGLGHHRKSYWSFILVWPLFC